MLLQSLLLRILVLDQIGTHWFDIPRVINYIEGFLLHFLKCLSVNVCDIFGIVGDSPSIDKIHSN